MGFRTLELKMKTDFGPDDLKNVIRKICRVRDFTYTIDKQSLDGRNPMEIHWLVRVVVSSPEIQGGAPPDNLTLKVPFKRTDKKVLVVGSGPAGFFAAYVCLMGGLDVTLVEMGPDVYQRTRDLRDFEKTGNLNERSNYAYGEGGAGTFSDGKLTSRTKSILREKRFIFEQYIKGGAPEEILYLAKPHLGSNILTKVVKNLRQDFIDRGGNYIFNNKLIDLKVKDGKVVSAETEQGVIDADYFIVAVGHSSYDTYRMMMSKGVQFVTKNFAIGTRVEHYQEIINRAKWRTPSLPGVKAADYSLTYSYDDITSVYSFCMCPGGKVVPAPPIAGLNIVNGMSYYKRNYPFANSAIVVGIRLSELTGKEMDPLESLEWLLTLERKFYDYSNSYNAPAVKVKDFLKGRTTGEFGKHSYPFDLVPADFRELFPAKITDSMAAALRDFMHKIWGFEDGTMMGLESRTSSPIQLVRDGMLCAGFDNLYFAGEGSGLAGGIVSSAADGIKCGMDVVDSIY
ncbi:MAG: FAD-dependent oxidoreductase [Candidatus Kapabacteria bacterium]|nr:FAD-dependent oxidoreductase [Ignavibacteriota bacterium]MCW5886051.1 FAD-dependent oxidoreductase [Candidatus Kapabacteria bacterium]